MMNYRQLLFIPCILLFIMLPKTNSTASNSLSDCQAVASKFRSTINSTAANITSTTGDNVTCSAMDVVCPGQNINGVCVWQRKLSAVCRNVNGTIKIRIQTNGLPPRCANVPMGAFNELNVDFEVNFNPDVSVNLLNKNLNTMSSLSQTLCTLTNPTRVPLASGFVNYGTTNLNTATGVSVDGVMIFSPDSENNVDPFYPPPGSSIESVDSCLAHTQSTGIYHYHIGTSCMINPPNGSLTPCASTDCGSNIANYSISSFNNYQTMTVIGIAKDGHIIYGPYLSATKPVTSGFDVCNGMFYDSIGNYAYFATSTYPYLVGCFGPGNYPSFGPNCTTNGISSYSMSSYAISFLNNANNSTNASSPMMPNSTSPPKQSPPSSPMMPSATSPPKPTPPSSPMMPNATSPPMPSPPPSPMMPNATSPPMPSRPPSPMMPNSTSPLMPSPPASPMMPNATSPPMLSPPASPVMPNSTSPPMPSPPPSPMMPNATSPPMPSPSSSPMMLNSPASIVSTRSSAITPNSSSSSIMPSSTSSTIACGSSSLSIIPSSSSSSVMPSASSSILSTRSSTVASNLSISSVVPSSSSSSSTAPTTSRSSPAVVPTSRSSMMSSSSSSSTTSSSMTNNSSISSTSHLTSSMTTNSVSKSVELYLDDVLLLFCAILVIFST